MDEERTQYKFTFEAGAEGNFRRIMGRLDPDEYTVVEEIHQVDVDKGRHSDLTTTMVMVPEAASTFRLGMKHLEIKRHRSDDEEAAIKSREDRHKVTITVQVPGDQL